MPVVARNPYNGHPPDREQSPTRIFAITPSDTDDVGALATTYIWCDTAGAIKVTLADDDANHAGVVLTVPARAQLKLAVRRVWSTGTTATGIVGMTIA